MKTMKEIEADADAYALQVLPKTETEDFSRGQHRNLIKLGYMRCFNDLQALESEKVVVSVPFSKNVFKEA